jgi:hypothetical protein
MKNKRAIFELTGRVLHALLVLLLSFLLFRVVWYAFSLLANDTQPGQPKVHIQDSVADEKPGPQDIVSMRHAFLGDVGP